MADPDRAQFDPASPEYRRQRMRGIQTFEYPGDVGSYKYCTIITFLKYKRSVDRAAIPSLTTESAVILPLPSNLAQAYGIDASPVALGLGGNIPIDTTKLNGKSVQDTMINAQNLIADSVAMNAASLNNAYSTVRDRGSQFMQNFNKGDVAPLILAMSKIFNENIQNVVGASVGVIANPHLAAMFNGVGLRKFQYNWKVSPRNQDEAIMLKRIFKHIKQNMHPSITQVAGFNATLSYPNQIMVTFPNLDNYTEVSRSFITDFVVDNTPNGLPSLFKDGSPTDIAFSISLTEAEIKTSEDFRDGAF